MKFFIIIYITLSVLSFGYDYPYKDPYLATVLATPSKDMPEFEKVDYEEIILETDNRDAPPNLWFLKDFRFGLMAQDENAPLIFLFAGTGSKYNSTKMVTMSQILYSNGFSVIMLPTSFDYNYIVSASKTHAPGYLLNDGEETYSLMKKVLEEAKPRLNYDDIYLTGYSLGGTMSLVLGEIDKREKYFNFKRIMAVNPSVSLFDSAMLLDNYLDDNVQSEEELEFLITKIILGLVQYSTDNQGISFDQSHIYSLFNHLNMNKEELKILIGLAFRFIAIDVNYISDIMTKSGVYSDPTKELTKYQSMDAYFKNINYSNFEDYITRIGLKTYQNLDPMMTFQDLKDGSHIKFIEKYIKKAENIHIVTNEDEIILTKENLDYLKDITSGKSRIYPTGGHCGNMFYKENIEYLINYLLRGETK